MLLQRKNRILYPHTKTLCAVLVDVKILKNRWIFKIKTPKNWLKMPPLKKGRADFLWEHSCVECFLFCRNAPFYWEYNFSFSQSWALYAFSNYREKIENPEVPSPQIHLSKKRHKTHEVYTLTVQNITPPPFLNFLHFCAVLENKEKKLFYFSEKHFKENPDFHFFPR